MKLFALLLISSACAVPERVWLDVPGDAEAKSIVFAVHDPALRVFAYAIEDGRAILPPVTFTGSAEPIEAALYADDLATLRLTAGELMPVEGATLRDVPMLLGVYRSTRDRDGFRGWEEAMQLSEDLGAFPVPSLEDDPCGELEGKQLFVPASDRALVMLSLDDAVLVASQDGQVFLVREDGFQIAQVTPAGVVLFSGVRDASGRFWFTTAARNRTTLWQGTIAGTDLTLEERGTTTGTVSRLVVSREDPLELIGIDRRGNLHRYDGTAMTEIYSPEDPRVNSKIVDLAVVEPGHVVAVHGDIPALLRYRDGAVTRETSMDQPRAVGMIPGFGLVVTSVSGGLYAVTDEWDLLGYTPIGLPLADVVVVPSGFLVGSDDGSVLEFVVDARVLCLDRGLPALGQPAILGARYQDGAMFSSVYDRGSEELAVEFVRRRLSR